MLDWTYERLRRLIEDEVPESLSLDYKRSAALSRADNSKKELSKDVTAFANSAGGTLIYGIEEESLVARALDGGVADNITAEWIEDVLFSTIAPRIDGLNIEQVVGPSGERFLIIDVAQAKSRGPHMAWDKRYYKRVNFKSVPMEDYEVRDVMRRREGPSLEVHLVLRQSSGSVLEATSQHIGPLQLRPLIINASETPAEYACVNLFLDARLECSGLLDEFAIRDNSTVEFQNARYDVRLLQLLWKVPERAPIFRDLAFTLYKKDVEILFPAATPSRETPYALAWEIRAPGMLTRYEIVRLRLEWRKLYYDSLGVKEGRLADEWRFSNFWE